MRLRLIVVSTLLIFLVSACCSNFKMKSHEFLAKNNESSFYVYGVDSEADEKVDVILDRYQIKDEFKESCGDGPTRESDQEQVSQTIVPVLATLGKYIFDVTQQNELKKLNALKKASTVSYSGRAFLTSGQLKRSPCIIMHRYHENSDGAIDDEVIAIAKINSKPFRDPLAFTIKPLYLKADNAVAYTLEDSPKINVTIGLAIKSIGVDRDSGLETLGAVGGSSVSIGELVLPSKAQRYCTKANKETENPCYESDLIPHVLADEALLSLSMSVTETGIVGIDFDQREAEITALKEAFGPAIEEAIKTALGDE